MARRIIPPEIHALKAFLASEVPPGTPPLRRGAVADVPHPLQRHLPDIERLAAGGLALPQIAARLGHSSAVVADAAARFVDVHAALVRGRGIALGLVRARLDKIRGSKEVWAQRLLTGPRIAPSRHRRGVSN